MSTTNSSAWPTPSQPWKKPARPGRYYTVDDLNRTLAESPAVRVRTTRRCPNPHIYVKLPGGINGTWCRDCGLGAHV